MGKTYGIAVGHANATKPTLREKFLSRIAAGPQACWIWTGYVEPQNYGRISLGHSRYALVHRFAYEEFVGPIPDGLSIDHVCHNRDESCPGGPTCLHRRCVNPDHLEPVTRGDNIRRSQKTPATINSRKTHCPRGHEYSPENTGTYDIGGGRRGRYCRACRQLKYRLARQQAAVASVPEVTVATTFLGDGFERIDGAEIVRLRTLIGGTR